MKELPFPILPFQIGDRRKESSQDAIIWILKLLVQRSTKFILKEGKINSHIIIEGSFLLLPSWFLSLLLGIYLGQSFGSEPSLPGRLAMLFRNSVLQKNLNDTTQKVYEKMCIKNMLRFQFFVQIKDFIVSFHVSMNCLNYPPMSNLCDSLERNFCLYLMSGV